MTSSKALFDPLVDRPGGRIVEHPISFILSIRKVASRKLIELTWSFILKEKKGEMYVSHAAHFGEIINNKQMTRRFCAAIVQSANDNIIVLICKNIGPK